MFVQKGVFFKLKSIAYSSGRSSSARFFHAAVGAGILLGASVSATCLAQSEHHGVRPAERQQRPNIVWIIAEGENPPFLPPYGNSTIQTPHLSRLAEQGIRFTHAYSVSGVCSPSRAALITGTYPTAIGADNMRVGGSLKYHPPWIPDYSVVPPTQVKFSSELLRKAGYYTINVGKTDYQIDTPVTAWNEQYNPASEAGLDLAAPLWRHRLKGHPFFERLNLEITHEHQIWARAGKPMLVDPAKVSVPPLFPDTPIVRKDIARNYSNIKLMDRQIGKLVSRLKQDGLLNNTIIFFFTDHGSPFPRYKRSLYDTGIHVPLIVRFPDKRRAGTVDKRLVSFVDFAPTLLSLAHVPIPDYMHGRVFLGNQKANKPRKYVYAARDRMDTEYALLRAVRDKRFEYLRNYEPEKSFPQYSAYRRQMAMVRQLLKFHREGKLKGVQTLWFRNTRPVEELYDTKKDPYEFHNLAGNPAYKGKLHELRHALNQWERKTRDLNFTPEKQLVNIFWPNEKQPVTKPVQFSEDKKKGTVTITCPSKGASIAYRLASKQQATSDERKAGLHINNWTVYTGPMGVAADTTLEAVAVRYGYKQSKTESFNVR
jgi:arylsulfatase A-like enzyme